MTLKILLLTCISLATAVVYSQQCTGNLGENIFTEGDFGSGTANVLLTDPGIAPGFTYQPSPPPNDGFYTITNNTARWANLFATWDGFSDNSSDPNGYFMVVNANFTPGKFYEQQVDNLCENTVYQFTADVRNMLRRGVNQLLPNVSFSIDGDIQFTTGAIAETQTWNTYGFTFTTGPGQTSLILALNNNAPGGNGNDLALDNITFRVCGPSASIASVGDTNDCSSGGPVTLIAEIFGDQFSTPAFQWQESLDGGLTWQDIPGATARAYEHNGQTGSAFHYRYLLAGSSGNLANSNCRVISDTKIINVTPDPVTVVDTICTGGVYAVGNNEFTSTVETTVTIPSFLGCDSVVTLRLTVLDEPDVMPDFVVTDPTCPGETDGAVTLNGTSGGLVPLTYTFNGVPRTVGEAVTGLAAGDYPYRFTDRFGCSTDQVLTLTGFPSFEITLVDTICNGESFAVGNNQYTTSGMTVDRLTTFQGCDSVVTLQLTVLDEPDVTPDFVVTNPNCPGQADGSVALLGVAGGFAPFSFVFNGTPATLGSEVTGLIAGDYPYQITDRFGCTSEMVLTLVDPFPQQIEVIDTICSGQSFTVGSNEYTTSGVTTDVLMSSRGCDSTVTLRLTVLADPMITPEFAVTDPNCADGTDGFVELVGLTGGTDPLVYIFDDLPRDLATPITNLTAGDYSYQFTDRFGCSAGGVLRLTAPLPFTIELGPDQVLELGESIRLDDGTTDEVATYSFTPAGIVDCTTDCDGLVITPVGTTMLSLLATSPLGCEARDSVRFVVLTPREVYLPNAFSPNGDGINDRFILFGDTPSVATIASLRIYDRWGGEVFAGENLQPNSIAAGWDGKINERLAASGLYHYTAEVVFLDGVVLPYAGSVMLVR